ncbi:MAG: hypothetical protein ACAH82_14995 [Solirubrobacteraceae bacterium]
MELGERAGVGPALDDQTVSPSAVGGREDLRPALETADDRVDVALERHHVPVVARQDPRRDGGRDRAADLERHMESAAQRVELLDQPRGEHGILVRLRKRRAPVRERQADEARPAKPPPHQHHGRTGADLTGRADEAARQQRMSVGARQQSEPRPVVHRPGAERSRHEGLPAPIRNGIDQLGTPDALRDSGIRARWTPDAGIRRRVGGKHGNPVPIKRPP